jgi:hypothetical protein
LSPKSAIPYEMEVPESSLSTSSAASEVMNPKDEGRLVAGGLGSNAGVQNLDVELEIEQKKSSSSNSPFHALLHLCSGRNGKSPIPASLLGTVSSPIQPL